MSLSEATVLPPCEVCFRQLYDSENRADVFVGPTGPPLVLCAGCADLDLWPREVPRVEAGAA